MHMPQPTDAHAKLKLLSGKWIGEETMHPSPWGPGGKRASKVDARMSKDGFFLISDYEQSEGGKPCYFGHGVMGFDQQTGRYLWYWVDSMGMPPAAATAGAFVDGRFHFEHETPHGKMRYLYDVSANEYKFKIEAAPLGGSSWSPFMEGVYKRAK